MDIKIILGKVLGIAKDKKFKVHFYNQEGNLTDTKELTYLQLGTYLITNAEVIRQIKIYAE